MTLIALAAAGRRIDAPATRPEDERFPSNMESRVAFRIRDALVALRPARVAGSAACGADILIQEAARDLGVPRTIVLPFATQAFLERSVMDRGEAWGARFESLLGDTGAQLVQLRHTDPTDDVDADRAYAEATAAIIECVAAGPVGRRGVLLVWEGTRRRPDDQTAALADEAVARGWSRYDVITLSADSLR